MEAATLVAQYQASIRCTHLYPLPSHLAATNKISILDNIGWLLLSVKRCLSHGCHPGNSGGCAWSAERERNLQAAHCVKLAVEYTFEIWLYFIFGG